MPTYEYKCDMDHKFEEVQSIYEEPLSVCLVCGSPCRRQISRTSFVLKGGGWSAQNYG